MFTPESFRTALGHKVVLTFMFTCGHMASFLPNTGERYTGGAMQRMQTENMTGGVNCPEDI
jgi:hypothetical protein